MRRDQGFTLFEMLVAIVIVALLSVIFLPRINNARQYAYHKAAYFCASDILQKELAYYSENFRYATPQELVDADLTPSCLAPPCEDLQPSPTPGANPGSLACRKGGVWWFVNDWSTVPKDMGVSISVWRTGSNRSATAYINEDRSEVRFEVLGQ